MQKTIISWINILLFLVVSDDEEVDWEPYKNTVQDTYYDLWGHQLALRPYTYKEFCYNNIEPEPDSQLRWYAIIPDDEIDFSFSINDAEDIDSISDVSDMQEVLRGHI